MAGTGTWGNIATNDPNELAYTLHMIDASGDHWTERLVVAITTTIAAVQAWIVLYQAVTQASVYSVTQENIWSGAELAGNATFLARSGIEQGINMSFKDPATSDLFPLRVVAPVPGVMEGANDIPDMGSAGMTNLVTATIGLEPTYDFTSAQYTGRRERTNNPRVVL